MINAIIRGSLGSFSEALLDFYLNNALWINFLVLAYALIIFISKHANQKISQAVKQSLIEKYGLEIAQKNERWFIKTLERDNIDWQAISQQTWIPIISKKGSWGFRIKNADTLKTIYTPQAIKALFQADPHD